VREHMQGPCGPLPQRQGDPSLRCAQGAAPAPSETVSTLVGVVSDLPPSTSPVRSSLRALLGGGPRGGLAACRWQVAAACCGCPRAPHSLREAPPRMPTLSKAHTVPAVVLTRLGTRRCVLCCTTPAMAAAAQPVAAGSLHRKNLRACSARNNHRITTNNI